MSYCSLLAASILGQNYIIWYKSCSPWQLLQLCDFMSCKCKVWEYNLHKINMDFLVVISNCYTVCLIRSSSLSRSKILLPTSLSTSVCREHCFVLSSTSALEYDSFHFNSIFYISLFFFRNVHNRKYGSIHNVAQQ